MLVSDAALLHDLVKAQAVGRQEENGSYQAGRNYDEGLRSHAARNR